MRILTYAAGVAGIALFLVALFALGNKNDDNALWLFGLLGVGLICTSLSIIARAARE